MMNKIKPQALLAEYIGTLMLAFIVLMSVGGGFDAVPTPVLAGLTLGLVVLLFGKSSGANINPGVTAGLVSIGKLPLFTGATYIVAQALGAISAGGVYNLLTDSDATPTVALASADYRVFAAEMIGMTLFTMGIASAIYQKLSGVTQAAAIGGSLTAGVLFAAVVSNGVLNPAVAFTIGSFNWAYALAPIAGGIVGMNLYKAAFTVKDKVIES